MCSPGGGEQGVWPGRGRARCVAREGESKVCGPGGGEQGLLSEG